MKQPDPQCLYNHEMLINFTTQTAVQSYDEPVRREQFINYIKELDGTQVTAIMCCPTAWRLPIYHSKVNPVWQEWGRNVQSPLPEADWKYFDKVFARVRRYMLSEGYEDPLQLTIQAAREIGREIHFSYRMNDNHYTHFNGERDVPTMDPLWRDHPEWRIPNMNGVRSNMDYAQPEVRQWYYEILEELILNYEVDGLELDFMRHNDFFHPEKVEEGLGLMTEFVRRISTLLDQVGVERGNRLKLSVRVPWSLARCRASGLDVELWHREGLVDWINVSTHYRTTAESDMRGFRATLPEAVLFGELHFSSGSANSPRGLGGTRHTTREIYETTAHSYFEQGADGVSLFNFAYVRDHHFHDPRLRFYLHREPDFSILETICNRAYLASRPRHYNLCQGFGQLPQTFPAVQPSNFTLYVAEVPAVHFTKGLLRLQFSEVGPFPEAVGVKLNGVELSHVAGSGELFPPATNEGLAAPLELFFFDVPLNAVRRGGNAIEVFVSPFADYFLMGLKKVQLRGIELAFQP